MATPEGVGIVSSLSRTYIYPYVVDNVYKSNPMFFRLNAAKKHSIQGGKWIEVPLVYQRFSAGGAYTAYDVLDVSPSDPVKSGALDWKQYYVPVTLSRLQLAQFNSPEAVLNGVKTLFKLAEAEMAEWLGDGIASDGTSNTKKIDGYLGAVDDGTVLGTYAGLSRTTNTWWKAQRDAATTTLTLASLQSMHGSVKEGGRAPTLILATQANYNRYWNLLVANQRFPSEPVMRDSQLADAGFDNLLFNGCPLVVDSHLPANNLRFFNEDYIELAVLNGVDFYMEDFVKPHNQDIFVATMHWMGNLIFQNCARQGAMTAVTA